MHLDGRARPSSKLDYPSTLDPTADTAASTAVALLSDVPSVNISNGSSTRPSTSRRPRSTPPRTDYPSTLDPTADTAPSTAVALLSMRLLSAKEIASPRAFWTRTLRPALLRFVRSSRRRRCASSATARCAWRRHAHRPRPPTRQATRPPSASVGTHERPAHACVRACCACAVLSHPRSQGEVVNIVNPRLMFHMQRSLRNGCAGSCGGAQLLIIQLLAAVIRKRVGLDPRCCHWQPHVSALLVSPASVWRRVQLRGRAVHGVGERGGSDGGERGPPCARRLHHRLQRQRHGLCASGSSKFTVDTPTFNKARSNIDSPSADSRWGDADGSETWMFLGLNFNRGNELWLSMASAG